MTSPLDGKRLVAVTLDDASIGRSSADVEHERAVAIYDLIESNSFAPVGHEGGPYWLHLGVVSNRLVFDVRTADDQPVIPHHLSHTPLKREGTPEDIAKAVYFLLAEATYVTGETVNVDGGRHVAL